MFDVGIQVHILGLLCHIIWILYTCVCVCIHVQCESNNFTPAVYWNFFPDGLEFWWKFYTPITCSHVR